MRRLDTLSLPHWIDGNLASISLLNAICDMFLTPEFMQ